MTAQQLEFEEGEVSDGKILLVTGSRSIKDYAIVQKYLSSIEFPIKKLIHGGAVGVDQLSGQWAKACNIPVQIYRPNFKLWPIVKYRWKGYIERDYEMVRQADIVVAIWDGKSSGTKKTFDYAHKLNKLHHVFETHVYYQNKK